MSYSGPLVESSIKPPGPPIALAVAFVDAAALLHYSRRSDGLFAQRLPALPGQATFVI
jgi:hypothetical protein